MTWCGAALEKYEWMSSLPIAKVKVAVRKHIPTRKEVFLSDVVLGTLSFIAGAVIVAKDAAGVCSIDWLNGAVFMSLLKVGLTL
jgi:uncharacterized membrane protein HdeD (DUF308 family)